MSRRAWDRLVISLMITGAVAFVGALAWIAWRVYRLPAAQRTDAVGFGEFLLALVGAAAAAVGAVVKRLAPSGRRSTDEVAAELAEAVGNQWTRAARERRLLEPAPIPVRWRRSSLPITGPVSAAVGASGAPARFPPLPGLQQISQGQLEVGGLPELFAVYGGLGSGRLVITGAPGAGKSSAAILLLLDALRHRERAAEDDQPQVPVPTLFTLHGWDPSAQGLEDWLTARLVEYPLFAGRNGPAEAAALLAGGKLGVILDGLDEIAEHLRPLVLEALSQQAHCRVVLLTRSDEMVAAALKAHFVGAAALEMQAVDSTTAADYLTRTQLDPPPASWQELIGHLRSHSADPLSEALSTPLTLTLVRDTYTAAEDVTELLDSTRFPGRQDIEDHLLDRVLLTAYAHRLGTSRPRYSLEQAERTLRYLAWRMSEDGTRDLAWWRIPQWVPMGPRVVVTGIVAGLVIGLVFELAFGLTFGLPYGLGWGLVLGLRSGPGRGTLKSIGRLRWRALITGDALVFGLIFGLAAGLISVLAFGLMVGAVFGLIFGLMVGLGSRLGSALEQPGWEETTPRDPLTSWQRDRDFGLMVGLAYGLPAGFVFGFVFGLVSGLVSGLAVELVLGVMGSQTWPTTLACTQLRISRHTPLRMIRFLEDARSRQVLRTVGPIYQFRHARLQDRLAGATPIRHA